jgi:hypothetical protein
MAKSDYPSALLQPEKAHHISDFSIAREIALPDSAIGQFSNRTKFVGTVKQARPRDCLWPTILLSPFSLPLKHSKNRLKPRNSLWLRSGWFEILVKSMNFSFQPTIESDLKSEVGNGVKNDLRSQGGFAIWFMAQYIVVVISSRVDICIPM